MNTKIKIHIAVYRVVCTERVENYTIIKSDVRNFITYLMLTLNKFLIKIESNIFRVYSQKIYFYNTKTCII